MIAADGPGSAGAVPSSSRHLLDHPLPPGDHGPTPHVVAESALAAANGAEATVGQLSIFAGPALAALVLAAGSPALVILVNAVTFAAAAAFVAAKGDLGGGRRRHTPSPKAPPVADCRGRRVVTTTPGVAR